MELLRTRLCEWRPVAIDALALAPSSFPEPRLAVGRANGAVELWDTSTWHLRRSSPGCERRSVRGFVWVAASEEEAGSPYRLVSAGLHTEITEWDLTTLEPLVSVPSGGGAVWNICAVGQRLFAACDDGSVRVFSLQGGSGEIMYARRIVVGKERVLSVALIGEDTLFVGGSNSNLTKWSISTNVCEAKMQMEQAKGGAETLVWALASLGESEIASGDSLGLVQIWDAIACTQLHRFVQHQADVLALAATPGGGGMLLSGGIDAKICYFYRQPDAEERWVVSDGDFYHTHDVRALVLSEGADRYISGGVTGKMQIMRLSEKSTGRPLECSSLSPLFQTACVAQDSRVVLCQRDSSLELWYLQPPKEPVSAGKAAGGVPVTMPGFVHVAAGKLPEAQLVLRVKLGGASEGLLITASAITPDGRLFAASDVAGTRLFHLSVEDLEVRCEKNLPAEVEKMAAGGLHFCGSGMLAVAAVGTSDVLMVDTSRLAVVARFTKHHVSPVTHLVSTGEWLASADPGGIGANAEASAHVFSLDQLQHHARVPIGSGRGFPTAMGFDTHGKRLIVVLSSHEVILWDVEAQALVQNLPAPMARIPNKLCPPHARISGIAAPIAQPNKVIFWGHNILLSFDLRPNLGEDKPSPKKKKKKTLESDALQGGNRDTKGSHWRRYPDIRYILGLCALDESRWGSPVLKDHHLASEQSVETTADSLIEKTPEKTPEKGASKKRSAASQRSNAMVLTLEVAEEVIQKSLPQSFQRKRFYGDPKGLK